MPLITLDDARLQLSMTHTLDDALISQKIVLAEAIIYDYIEKEPEFWFDQTVSPPEERPAPGVLIAACLMVTAALYENREGYDGGQSLSSYSQSEPLSGAVKNLLRRFRDPAVG
jgi:hypothetical protein